MSTDAIVLMWDTYDDNYIYEGSIIHNNNTQKINAIRTTLYTKITIITAVDTVHSATTTTTTTNNNNNNNNNSSSSGSSSGNNNSSSSGSSSRSSSG